MCLRQARAGELVGRRVARAGGLGLPQGLWKGFQKPGEGLRVSEQALRVVNRGLGAPTVKTPTL